MKVIVAIDDSPYSEWVIDTITKRHWAANTEFRILNVVEPVHLEELGKGKWIDVVQQSLKRREDAARQHCEEAREKLKLQIPDSIVHFELRHGAPREEIIKAATEWSADKVVLGAHGRNICPRFILGSVSRAIATHAPCSVEIIRSKKLPVQEIKSESTAGKVLAAKSE